MTKGRPEVLLAWSEDKGTGGVPSTTALSYLNMSGCGKFLVFIIIDVMCHPPRYGFCTLLFLAVM